MAKSKKTSDPPGSSDPTGKAGGQDAARLAAAGASALLKGRGKAGLKRAAALAGLAVLGYRVYQEYRKPHAGGGSDETGAFGARLANVLRGRPAEPATPRDGRETRLLIRAMIAAARSDGELTGVERRRIVAKLDEAGAGPAIDRIVQEEFRAPQPPPDEAVQDAKNPETAELLLLAAKAGVGEGTPAERDYLRDLAERLGLAPEGRTDPDAPA